MAEAIETQQDEHHLVAGFAYLLLAATPVVVVLMRGRDVVEPGVLLPVVVFGFLSGCAFYRARFGSDSLPDRLERARRSTTYAAGLLATISVLFWIVIGIVKLL